MNIKSILDKLPLPAIYEREGKLCYFDTFRKKLIEITPEETVRQKTAIMFETYCNVPKDMISLESHMSHYVKGATGRADIIIHAIDEESHCKYPLMIIECKNENISLTDKVLEQAIRYCDMLGGLYIAVTNGNDIRLAMYDDISNSYIFINELLMYHQMLNKDFLIPEIKEYEFERFTFDELNNQQLLSEYNNAGTWIFGEGTNEKLRTLSINLYQAFLDTKHKLLPIKRKNFELLEDIGIRYMDYGNAGGGHYNGEYRAFLVKDRFGETQIVSMSLFGTDANFRGESRNSYTSLTMAIDRFKTSHNSLQYNMDRFVSVHLDGTAKFVHNGQISGLKSDKIIEKILTVDSSLGVSGNAIFLGNINTNKLFYLNDNDVSNLIYNLIEYALLREEVRIQKRNNKL